MNVKIVFLSIYILLKSRTSEDCGKKVQPELYFCFDLYIGNFNEY